MAASSPGVITDNYARLWGGRKRAVLGIFGDQLAALKHLCQHWVVRGGVNLLAIGDFSVMRARDLQGAPRSGRLRFDVRPCSARCSRRALLSVEQCLGTLLRRALLIEASVA